MKRFTHIFLILIIIGAAVGIGGSCSDVDNCSLDGRAMIYCTIKTINPDYSSIVLNDTLDSLTITALGTDSIILNNDAEVHTLMLPLRYTSDTTVFVFHYDPVRKPADTDTLYIVHENNLSFVSMDCGYAMEQNIVSVWKGKAGRQGTPEPDGSGQPDQIDSLSITSTEANTDETENLQIFYNYRESRMSDDEEDE